MHILSEYQNAQECTFSRHVKDHAENKTTKERSGKCALLLLPSLFCFLGMQALHN